MLNILRNKTFLLFFLGNIISLIGFGFNLIAFSWLVLEKTGSEFALGKIMAAATTPGLILALFAGVIIDKVNRKWLLVILDIFRVFVLAVFIYNFKVDGFNLLVLYPVMMLMGLGNSLFWPTAHWDLLHFGPLHGHPRRASLHRRTASAFAGPAFHLFVALLQVSGHVASLVLQISRRLGGLRASAACH